MAGNRNNMLTRNYSGKIGKEYVLKNLPNDKTILTKYPDRTTVILSDTQKISNRIFRKAVAFAKLVNSNPEKKAELKAEDSRNLQLIFSLTERQYTAIKYLALGEELNNAAYQNFNKVSKATATRDLQDLVSRGVLQPEGKGASVKYRLAEGIPEPK